MIRTITILAFSAALAACGPTRMFIKTYDGAPLAENEAALLKPFLGVKINSINGDKTKAVTPLRPGNPTNIDADISFKPGQHSISVGYFIMLPNATYWSTEDHLVEFNALAGHKYLLKGEQRGESWRPIVEDVTNDPSKWCWSDWDCRSGPSKPMPTDKIR